MKLVNAEQNFNPNGGGKPKFCGNPALPKTAALRGILPKISEEDNLNGAAAFNVVSDKSLADALAGVVKNVDGKSVADQIVEAGFSDFTGAPAAPAGGAGVPAPPAPPADTNQNKEQVVTQTVSVTVTVCPTEGAQPTQAVEPAPAQDSPQPQPATNAAANCNYTPLEVAVQGSERRFGQKGQLVALNPVIVAEQICNQDRAQNSADCQAKCDQVKTALGATGIKGGSNQDLAVMGKVADDFNAALGKKTDFEGKLGGAGNAGDNGAGNGNNNAGGNGANNTGGGACNYQDITIVPQGEEQRFGKGAQAVALNPVIVAEQICNEGRNQNDAQCQAKCDQAKTALGATGIKGGKNADVAVLNKVADDFNGATA